VGFAVYKKLLLVWPIFFVTNVEARFCVPAIWRILYTIKTPQKIQDISAKLLSFKEDEADDSVDLDTETIALLPMYSHGQNQYVYEIPHSDELVKIRMLRTTYSKATQLQKTKEHIAEFRTARSLFPKFFPPEKIGSTNDGYYFVVQKKVALPPLLKRKKYLLELLDDFKKEHPTANIEFDEKSGNYFISILVNNKSIKIADLNPSNIGIYNGRTVIIDSNISVHSWN